MTLGLFGLCFLAWIPCLQVLPLLFFVNVIYINLTSRDLVDKAACPGWQIVEQLYCPCLPCAALTAKQTLPKHNSARLLPKLDFNFQVSPLFPTLANESARRCPSCISVCPFLPKLPCLPGAAQAALPARFCPSWHISLPVATQAAMSAPGCPSCVACPLLPKLA